MMRYITPKQKMLCVEYKKSEGYCIEKFKFEEKFDIKDIVGQTSTRELLVKLFFVIYFISDKGHKFNRHLRPSMITGKSIDGRPIKKNLHRLMFIFNKFIETSIEVDIQQ